MKNFWLCILWMSCYSALAQSGELHLLKGKIICPTVNTTEIKISNQRSESIVNPEINGNFSMFVKVGDKLLIECYSIEPKEIQLTEEDLNKKLFVVSVNSKIIPLDNVDVKTYKGIDAVSLGILQKPAKKYTPAERKLRTAETFHWFSPLLIPFGGMSIDGLINSISGRTNQLKKELEIERNERTIQTLKNQFDETYFTKVYAIPKEQIEAFLYFVADNAELRQALKEKNKIKMEFTFAKLATAFLNLQNETK